MLESLHIRNYALIDTLDIDVQNGLSVLSGETGAGKSILIGALSLLLGGKGDGEAIRTGAKETEVSALIRLDTCQEALHWLEEHSIEPEDGAVLLRRTIKHSGRGTAYIQSVPATRKDLSELTGYLFDLHGQHEHQSLFSIDQHRRLLDRFGGNEDLANRLSETFSRVNELRKELTELQKDERDLLRQRDLLEYAISEIDAAGLVAGEVEDLERERHLLSQSEKLFSLLDTCHDLLSESKGGVLGDLREAVSKVGDLCDIDDALEAQRLRLENAFYEVEDVDQTLRNHLQGLDFSPERLDECESRLQAIHRLEKKYGDSVEAVLAYRANAAARIEAFEGRDQQLCDLEKELKEREQELMKLGKELSSRRKAASVDLERKIMAGLQHLGMPKVQFRVSSSYREGKNGGAVCGPNGFDRIEFLISPNQGEPERPLKDIASGGELSRVMLAIKSALSETDQVETLIFDEIDTGIGGEVAVSVADYLSKLSEKKQVLCITHLASIAVRADNHIIVEKCEQEGRTFTDARALASEQRVSEVARMLSGTSGGDASLEHARQLLERAGCLS